MHCGPKKPSRVLRVTRDRDIDPGIMGEGSLVGLAMPEAAAWKISAIGGIDDERTGPGAKRAPAQVAEIRHDLVPSRSNEVDELQFEDRPFAVRCEPTGDAHDCRFSEGRIENLLWEFGRKILRETENAALRIFHVLAKDDASRVFRQAGTQRLVHDITDPVFAGGKHFVVELVAACQSLPVPVHRLPDPGRVPPR